MTSQHIMRACLAAMATVVAVGVASCQANPGDAPTVEEQATSTTAPAPLNQDERGKGKQITVGVDAFTTNLNPHLAGNESPLISAIADLTLPSVFVPGPGGWVQDDNLVREVIPDDPSAPTTIKYKLNPQAQWSDGTPVTSSDFEYLVSVMANTPGVERAGGYRRIATFDSHGSATEFTVTMKEPYVPWKELFRHVLPSHIYRAENHVFGTMMDGSSAASAGRYVVSAVDSGRGIIELQRNDRFWGAKPAETDKLVFASVPDTPTAVQMLRTGQIQMVAMRPAEQSELSFAQIKDVQQRTAGRAVQLNLTANLRSTTMRNSKTRGLIMRSLDRDVIAKIVSTRSQPPAPKWDIAPDVLAGTPEKITNAPHTAVVIGADTDDPMAVNAARTAADQLSQAGFNASVKTMEANELHTKALVDGSVDLVAHWQHSPASPSQYADQFGCTAAGETPGKKKTGSTAATGAAESGANSKSNADSQENADQDNTNHGEATQQNNEGSGNASGQPDSATPTNHGGAEGSGSGASAPKSEIGNNISGFCSPQVDRRLSSALTSDTDRLFGDREMIDQAVAAQNVILPLLGEQQLVAVNSRLQGPSADLADWPLSPMSGIFPTAARWTIGDVQTTAAPSPNDVPSPSKAQPSSAAPTATTGQ